MAYKRLFAIVFAVALVATASRSFGFGVPIDLLMPDPPTGLVATAGNGEATVSFDPPRVPGIKPITHYTLTAYPGCITATGSQSPITIRGLTNGRVYTFTVKATNSIGTGLDSAPSNRVTPTDRG